MGKQQEAKNRSDAPRGWKAELQTLIDEHNQRKADGRRIASHKTQDERAKSLFRGFRDLRKLGFPIENPRNLKPKHLKALFGHWEERGLSAATIQTQISFFRVYCRWIGKPDMVGSSESYMTDPKSAKRVYEAQHDKSWSAKGIDVHDVIRRMKAISEYVAIQLLMIAAFGLRRKEAVMFRPFLADHGNVVVVSEGTKGNRPRVVPITDPWQRAALEKAKAFVKSQGQGETGHLGDPTNNLDQNLRHYSHVMTRCGITMKNLGITGHGVRAQVLCDMLESHGVKPTVRGGRPEDVDRETAVVAYTKVTNAAGHGRRRVVGAYAGGFDWSRTRQPDQESEGVAGEPVGTDGPTMSGDATAAKRDTIGLDDPPHTGD